jgi:hypothetical protein
MEKVNGMNCTGKIEGKLQEVIEIKGRNGLFFKNVIIAPGEDEYDYPNPLAVISERRLGKPNDIVTAVVKLQGRISKGENATFHNTTLWEIKD